MSQSICLADGGKHRWKYDNPRLRSRRECQKCGTVQEKQDGKWRQTGSTRWKP